MNFEAIIFVAVIPFHFADTEAGNFSEATDADYRNNTDGEAYDSGKRIIKENLRMTFDRVIKGRNVQLSSDLRTATLIKPTRSVKHASVVSNSIIEEDQVFQIRIDGTIEKWSDWGIAIGVIEEKKEEIKDARYIYGIKSIKGTWAINSWHESQSGKSDTFKDGNRITDDNLLTRDGYPLSTLYLQVGTLLGVSRRSNGNLHFYLDGVDKGAAFVNVSKDVYAFVDIINYVTRISITS